MNATKNQKGKRKEALTQTEMSDPEKPSVLRAKISKSPSVKL